MKAKIQLWREGSDSFTKVFNWDDVIDTNNGKVRIAEISVFYDKPVIEGKEHHIVHMLSADIFSA